MAARVIDSAIVDASGRPMQRLEAHYGADPIAPELRGWYPQEYSPDHEILPELPTLRARVADLIRNHGLTSGAVQTHLDNIIGPNLKLVAKPDHRRLGIAADVAAEWARSTESAFRDWAEDPDCYCDASRRHQLNGLISMAYRSYLTSFESVATIEWLPDRGGKYATAIQQLDPALMCNPDGQVNTASLRDGVALDPLGAPIGYWFASHLPNDPYTSVTAMRRFRYVPRQTPWGRQLVVHAFDGDRPGQTRGRTGIVSVIANIKMLQKFEQVSVQAAILNAMYAATIESPMSWELVGAGIGARNDRAKVADPLNAYLANRSAFHKDGYIQYNGLKIPHLYPGEKLELKQPQHPHAAFAQFEEAVLRHLAGGFNLTYEQFSRDYSKTNYSSARAAMIEAWRFFSGRRHFIAARIASAYYAAWLEEAMDSGAVETPAGAPSFWEAKAAWSRAQWLGPGKGHIDPLKEETATKVAFDNQTTTLEKECAERGLDWEEVLEQRAAEAKRRQELEAEYGVSLGPMGESPAAGATPDDNPEDETQQRVDDGEITEDEAEDIRQDAETYGVAVRAGAITPQQADEAFFRGRMKLPEMSDDVNQAWLDDQGTRRPVTLAQSSAGPAQGQLFATPEDAGSDERDDTSGEDAEEGEEAADDDPGGEGGT